MPAAALDGGSPVLLATLAHWSVASEPRCWAAEHFSRTPVQYEYEYEDYRAFPTACVPSVLHWAD